MKVNIVIDIDRITLNDLSTLEQTGDQKLPDSQVAKDFLWRFIADDSGEYLPDDEARAIVGKLGVGQALKAVQEFKAAIGGIKSAAVPPQTETA